MNATINKPDICEAENWLTAIEFIRTKVAFESFVSTYGQV
jgi:hypothetical protein